jgi:tetratricopeptide (TPR) repeat protein
LLPDNAAVFNHLGMACFLTRRVPQAIEYLRRSVALNPRVARTFFNLGLALEQMGDASNAIAAYRRAVEVAPDMAEAHARAADLLLGTSGEEEAITAYERAAKAAPETTVGRLAVAKALSLRNQPDEAERVLRALVAGDPSCADAHLVLGTVLEQAGHFEDAASSFERAIALEPSKVYAHLGWVRSRRLTETDRPMIDRILSRIRELDPADPARMTLHFAAGKALDDLKDYAGAIAHFDAANRIRRRLAPFDAAGFARFVDRLIDRFRPDLFARAARDGEADDETAVLILGMPRSGTTLIERVVSSHPAVAGGGELAFWNEHARAWVDAEPDVLAPAANGLREDYLRVLRAIGPDALRVTDKMPFNFLWIGLVHRLLPRARVVHCRRNPVDTCLSVYTTQFAQSWGFASDRADLASYYRQYLRLMEHWRAVLPPDRFIDVDYEEATAAPEAFARRLLASCGLPWDPACLQPERNPDVVKTASKWQARQPVYRTSVERWRNYEPWLGELRDLLH